MRTRGSAWPRTGVVLLLLAALAGITPVGLAQGEEYAFAFGLNEHGQLGLGDTDSRDRPAKIGSLSGAVGVAAGGSHSLLLVKDDFFADVYAFGNNEYGQLGLGYFGGSAWLPTMVDELNFVVRHGGTRCVAAAGGGEHSLVLLESGEVYAFGRNHIGQLGLGDLDDRHTPTKIEALPGPATAVAAGWYYSLVLLENGDVYAFGVNASGQLGQGDTTSRRTPTKVPLLSNVVAVAAGSSYSLVLLENGDVYAFGSNFYGQLGLGDTEDRDTPTRVPGLSNAVSVFAGGNSSLVLLENGDVYAFGRNTFGQLGLGHWDTPVPIPTTVEALPGPARAAAAGGSHSLVLLENGDVYAFGNNFYGRLGLGPGSYVNTPTRIPTLSNVVALCGGGRHSIVLMATVDVPLPDGFQVRRETGDVLTPGAFHGLDFRAGGADLAEWVAVSEPAEHGHVLEIDPTTANTYRLALGPCSVSVAGVVSTAPGMVLGGELVPSSRFEVLGEDHAQLALLGVVPVKVTDEGGPIAVGDLLTVSSTPGHAMRWDPENGTPCALVGKALQAHPDGKGVIEVLLTR